MCQWPRIQAALTESDALNVTYRTDRGEPRMCKRCGMGLRGILRARAGVEGAQRWKCEIHHKCLTLQTFFTK